MLALHHRVPHGVASSLKCTQSVGSRAWPNTACSGTRGRHDFSSSSSSSRPLAPEASPLGGTFLRHPAMTRVRVSTLALVVCIVVVGGLTLRVRMSRPALSRSRALEIAREYCQSKHPHCVLDTRHAEYMGPGPVIGRVPVGAMIPGPHWFVPVISPSPKVGGLAAIVVDPNSGTVTEATIVAQSSAHSAT
jgi:hypothetical protein